MANALERAKQVIDSRRLAAEDAATQRRIELEAVSPELKEVNYRISRAGIEAVRAAGNPDAFSKLAQASVENKARRDAILQGLGLPVDALEPHYTCPKCSDTGVCDGHYCTCLKALVEQFRVDSLSSVTPLKQSTFEDFKLNYYSEPALSRMTQIYNYCKAWAEDFDRSSGSILLYGQTGLGKTHLSLAIANVVLAKGYNVVYTSAGNLFSKLEKESFGRLSSDETPMDTAISCDLLILDDLGSEFTKPFVVSALYNIVNSRILAGLPTIINTNLSYAEIEAKYDPRIVSRLLGSYTMLECLGSDVRQLKKDE